MNKATEREGASRRVKAELTRAELFSRGVKGGAALLVAGSAASLLAPAAVADPLPDNDLAYVRLLVGTELLGIDFYTRALAAKKLSSNGQKYLKAALLNEKEHYQSVAGILSGAGLVPAVSADIDFAYPKGSFDTAGAVTKLAARLETAFLGAYLGAAGGMQSSVLLGGVAASPRTRPSTSACSRTCSSAGRSTCRSRNRCRCRKSRRHGHVHGLSTSPRPSGSYSVLRAVVTDVKSDGRDGTRRAGRQRSDRLVAHDSLRGHGRADLRPGMAATAHRQSTPSSFNTRERVLMRLVARVVAGSARRGAVAAPACGGNGGAEGATSVNVTITDKAIKLSKKTAHRRRASPSPSRTPARPGPQLQHRRQEDART